MTPGRKPLLEKPELLSRKVTEADGIVGSQDKEKKISSKVK